LNLSEMKGIISFVMTADMVLASEVTIDRVAEKYRRAPNLPDGWEESPDH